MSISFSTLRHQKFIFCQNVLNSPCTHSSKKGSSYCREKHSASHFFQETEYFYPTFVSQFFSFFFYFRRSLKHELLRVPDVKYTEYEWLIGYRRNSTKLDLMFLRCPSQKINRDTSKCFCTNAKKAKERKWRKLSIVLLLLLTGKRFNK